ncbi:hypothetical protein D3C85_1330930 [compost metagenome]
MYTQLANVNVALLTNRSFFPFITAPLAPLNEITPVLPDAEARWVAPEPNVAW